MSTITQRLFESDNAIWVDVLLDGDEDWTPLFTYSSIRDAQEMRDHWKGVRRVSDYQLYLCQKVLDARVRVVDITVTINP